MDQRPATALAARAIEYSGLVVLVGGTFLGVVVAAGAALGREAPDAGLTLAAAVMLAVTFEPARRGLRRLANRLVYGHRSSPWEAVSRLSAQMGHDSDPADLLDELADVARAGTGASRVVVWLRVETTWLPTAGSPDTGDARPLRAGAGEPPPLAGADLTVAIRHGGELLGAVAVATAGRGSLLPMQQRLLHDLGSHAGVVTRTLRLRETLHHRLQLARRQHAELVASRREVVAAHDEERRRLERDIHDSCQQQAVVLAGRLGLAGTLAGSDPRQARTLLHEAAADVTRLDSAVRRLTAAQPHPVLVTDGVAAALRTEAAHLPVAVEVEDLLDRRFHPDVEAAIYFCAMEAIQNAIRHGDASRIQIRLAAPGGSLHCTVRDDGTGFDVEQAGAGTGLRNLRERLRPWDGELGIHSSPTGSTVEVRLRPPAQVAR